MLVKAVLNEPWAILEESLSTIIEIAGRENQVSEEMLERYRAETHNQGEQLKVRKNVGILDVKGAMFKYGNLFTAMSGATSYEGLARDFQVAMDDKHIDTIVLKVDSPGGLVSGCDEFAAQVYEARKTKKIVAYVSGMAASAGYFIASAADSIVVSDVAQLGSIGVMIGAEDRSKQDAARGIDRITIISSQSPMKNIDPKIKAGLENLQKRADDLAKVFVDAVAKHRDTTYDNVIKNFGAGGVEIGANAVDVGMADEVGQFEDLIAKLQNGGNVARQTPASEPKGEMMSNTENKGGEAAQTAAATAQATQEATAKASEDSRQAERSRIRDITQSDNGKKAPATAEHLAYDTDISASAAEKILTAAAKDVGEPSEPKKEENQTGTQTAQETGKKDEGAYVDRKTEAGALGVSSPEPVGKDAATAKTEEDEATAAWDDTVKAKNAELQVG